MKNLPPYAPKPAVAKLLGLKGTPNPLPPPNPPLELACASPFAGLCVFMGGGCGAPYCCCGAYPYCCDCCGCGGIVPTAFPYPSPHPPDVPGCCCCCGVASCQPPTPCFVVRARPRWWTRSLLRQSFRSFTRAKRARGVSVSIARDAESTSLTESNSPRVVVILRRKHAVHTRHQSISLLTRRFTLRRTCGAVAHPPWCPDVMLDVVVVFVVVYVFVVPPRRRVTRRARSTHHNNLCSPCGVDALGLRRGSETNDDAKRKE